MIYQWQQLPNLLYGIALQVDNCLVMEREHDLAARTSSKPCYKDRSKWPGYRGSLRNNDHGARSHDLTRCNAKLLVGDASATKVLEKRSLAVFEKSYAHVNVFRVI